MSLASVCKESFNLASVCVCLPCFFSIVNGCVVVFGVLTVSWSVVCVIMWVQSGFGWCAFACMSARLGSAGCSSVEVCGCERCVDLEIQKEGKKSTPKGREAEVTSTVRERSHANNARVLCLECQLKIFLAKNARINGVFCFLEC